MRNLSENLATFFAFILTALAIFLIVQYNMIDTSDKVENIVFESSEKPKSSTYLQNIEGYTDVDVQVDAKKESMTNTVVIKSELNQNAIDATVGDREKSSYMKNLKDYSQKSKDEKLDEIEPLDDGVGEPQKLDKDEVEDTIGSAIDALLDN